MKPPVYAIFPILLLFPLWKIY